MPDGIKKPQVSAVIHLPSKLPYPLNSFYKMVQRILQQNDQPLELIILDQLLDEEVANEVSRMNTEGQNIVFIREPFSTLGAWLNAARARSQGEFMLYLDNRTAEVYLKQSATSAFLITAMRNPKSGMIYSDYEISEKKKLDEVHLLKPHAGRLRDNQDYGRVFFYKKSALSDCSGFDESLRFNTLYDMRLKLQQTATPVHISNRYSGSLYQVKAQGQGHNVFDYLLASKESQIEAENVLTDHLKRINAFLTPGRFYTNRPESESVNSLKASVIIPVNNRPEFIPLAIESILAQTVQEIEVIVVINGGPDDPTQAVVQRYMAGGDKYNPGQPEVRMLNIDINNIGLCLNLGAQSARGTYYVQLDSDDRLKPDAVEKIVKVFESDPRIGIVIGSYEVWEKNDTDGSLSRVNNIPVVTHDEWTEENGRNNLLRINGAGAPRSIPIQVIKSIGYFGVNDEAFARNYGEDYEMVLKISEKYRVGRVWDPIYEVVRHSGGTDHSIDIATIQRNDEAKDLMRYQAITRRQKMNNSQGSISS